MREMEINWKGLQNGSDIRGVAMDGIPGEQVNLDAEVVKTLGRAFAIWLKTELTIEKPLVAVGRDSRLTGEILIKAFINGLNLENVDAADCGLASTPAMFMATRSKKLNAIAGVMITASHLPFNRNGLKFFVHKGGLEKEDISRILEIAASVKSETSQNMGKTVEYDLISEYSEILVETIRKGVNHPDYIRPLGGMKILVDAGNGAGGFFAHKVLVPLGADISGSQFLEPDGNFPNHVPNPEDEKAMNSVCQAVINNKAGFGIIFDTDVDRSAVVDNLGNPINRNALIALISAIIAEEHPKSYIVTDSITSEGLSWFINKKLNCIHHRFKRGYKNVINEAIRLNNQGKACWLAIETSGHAALKENYFLDDGAYLVAKILIKLAQLQLNGKNINELINEMPVPAESIEYRLAIKSPDFKVYAQNVLEKIREKVKTYHQWEIEPVNYEGIRVRCMNQDEKGWFLARMSLHDPILPVNIESDVENGTKLIASKLRKILGEFELLDFGSWH
ncbi:MAG: phosphomannomutase/phosphoglucomutase [Bacteroidales bacterium]